MRGINARVEAPMTLLETSVDFGTSLRQMLRRAWAKVNHAACPVLNGGHELYRARSDSKLFQQCLLCGYETPGWTIDRRDRKLHLVSGKKR